MGTDQNPKCAQSESVAPATALAYLDPKYWSISTMEFLSDCSSSLSCPLLISFSSVF